MKSSNIIILALVLFVSTAVIGQTSQKIAQIHTMPNETKAIFLEMSKNQVEIVRVKGTRISVEAVVRMSAGTAPLLDYLVKSGRYELKATIDAIGSLTLSPQKNKNPLMIKGEECQEVITYVIHIPETVDYVETLDSKNVRFATNQN